MLNVNVSSSWQKLRYDETVHGEIVPVFRARTAATQNRMPIRWWFGLVGDFDGHVSEVSQCWSYLVLGEMIDCLQMGKPSQYVISLPGQLSLAIPP